MSIWTNMQTPLTVGAVVAVLNGLFLWLVDAKIKASVDVALENYRFELKTREQAAKIAEYTSRALFLKSTDDAQTYQRANQLSWELFLVLPTETYRKLAQGLRSRENTKDLVDSLVDVRKVLLGPAAGDLNRNDIIIHAPNAARLNQLDQP